MSALQASVVVLWVVVLLFGAVLARVVTVLASVQRALSGSPSGLFEAPSIDVGRVKRALVFIGSECEACHHHAEELNRLADLGAEVVADGPGSPMIEARPDIALFNRYQVPGTPFGVVVGEMGTRRLALGSRAQIAEMEALLIANERIEPVD